MGSKRTAPLKKQGALQLRGKKILVLGLGRSGLSAVKFLLHQKAKVLASDDQGPQFFRGKIPASVSFVKTGLSLLSQKIDLIVVSPGVSWNKPFLIKARKKGIPILPEFELGWNFHRPRKTIAVTGTNGKTTTTAMIGWILNKSGQKVVVAGNIGRPLTSILSPVRSILVLELSSYQLEAHQNFRPDVGVWLNLTPDHLARHKTMANYAKIKTRLFVHSKKTDLAVLNQKDRWCRLMAKKINCPKKWFPTAFLRAISRSLALPGEHNQENAMAAAQAALAVGVSAAKIRTALKKFKGVPHRMELVKVKNGVSFINDSKATNVDSTLIALRASGKGVHLIMGGEHKGAPYTPLKRLIKSKAVMVYAIGEASSIIAKDLKNAASVLICDNLKNAVKAASSRAKKGEVVLLSPACASFDQFKNFEMRGDAFKKLVKKV